MRLTNYHTHTQFCDGSEHPEKYISEALKQGFSSLGFSAHATLPFKTKWTVPKGKLIDYYQAIASLKEKYQKEIEIYCGLELDYIPHLWGEIQELSKVGEWDYIIGSIHFVNTFPDGTPWTIDGGNQEFKKGFNRVFQNNASDLIHQYFNNTRQMIREMKPDVIGHIDKLKMQHTPGCFVPDTDEIFRKELLLTLDEIKTAGCIVEINTRGVYRRNEAEYYPGKWAINEMSSRKIPVTISSDAHKPEDISKLHDNALTLLYSLNYRNIKILEKGIWVDEAIDYPK